MKKPLKRLIARALRLLANGSVQPPLRGQEELSLIAGNYITADELKRLKTRICSTSVLLGKSISITDSFWYLHSLKEIFAEETYRFQSPNSIPSILDCGSNIGMSVIYFKRLFPKARIVAFEPDVNICNLLKDNLRTFGYEDVTVENKAVWRETTMLHFSASGCLGGRLSDSFASRKAHAPVIRVPTVRLNDYLHERIDFLKVDIEGSEVEVLDDCADQLRNVQNLFVEYHSDPEVDQQLDRLLSIIKAANFRVYIREAWNNLPFPFLRHDYEPCYDLQLNIFAYRAHPTGLELLK